MELEKERKRKEMNKVLEKYMNETIKMFGFEDKRTVDFCKMCEECEEGILPFEFVQDCFYCNAKRV